jgi:hypothetical protein
MANGNMKIGLISLTKKQKLETVSRIAKKAKCRQFQVQACEATETLVH